MELNNNKIKKHIKNVLLYMTSTSVMLASCDAGHYADELLASDEHFAANEKEGVELLPIDIYIDAPTKQKMANISQFAHDVASQQGGLIDEMNSNPQVVLDRYGLSDFKLDRNSLEVQAILALGDPDVQKSLQNGDFRRYIQVLNEKGLLQSAQTEQLKKLMTDPECSIQVKAADACFFVLPLIMVAIVEVAIAVHAGIWVETSVMGDSVIIEEPTIPNQIQHSISRLMSDEAMRLWLSNDRNISTYSMSDVELNKVINLTVSAIEHIQLADAEKEKIIQLCIGTYKQLRSGTSNEKPKLIPR